MSVVRSLTNVMELYRCDQETAQRYIDLREEGYSQTQALLQAGLSDPPDPDACGCKPGTCESKPVGCRMTSEIKEGGHQ